MKNLTVKDSRINRYNCFGFFEELSSEIIKSETGFDKDVSGGTMTYDYFKGTAYKKNDDDVQVDIVLDFNTQTATITYEEPRQKTKIEMEMEQWEARANDEFGQTLREIEKASMSYFGCDEDEYGIRSTPLSYPISGYSLDGDRKFTYRVIIAILDEWDILEDDNIKKMADRLNKLSA